MKLTGCIGCMMCFCLWLPAAEAEPMSLHVTDGDVRTILDSTASLGGINLVLDDAVQGTLTLHLDAVEPEEALQLIARARGLTLVRSGDAVIIGQADTIGESFYRMHVFSVKHADLKMLQQAVNLSLQQAGIPAKTQNIRQGEASETGAKAVGQVESLRQKERVLVDYMTNSLLLYGSDAEAEQVQQLLDVLDVPVQQVSLEARVVAIQKDASKKLGIEWEWSKLPQYPNTTNDYESVRHSVLNADGTYTTVYEEVPRTTTERAWRSDGSVPGIVRFGHGPEGRPFEWYYAAKLQALITDGKANLLAKPNITTLQGREAVINIGGEVPVPTVATTNAATTTSISYRPSGIILRYTPRVNEDGYITAEVHTEVSSPLYVEELKAYRFQKRSADTMVRLRDGETMVIGGLIGSEESRSLSKIPFLGDLPILGAFFRSVRNTKADSEIMIFLTAHVLKDT